MAGHDIIEKAQTPWLYTLVSFPFPLLFGAPTSTDLWRVPQRNFQSHIVVIAWLSFMSTSLWRLWSLRDLLVALFKFIEIVNFFSGNSWKKVLVETSKLYSGLFKVLFLVRELKTMRLFPRVSALAAFLLEYKMGVKLESGGPTVNPAYEPFPLPGPLAVASVGVSRASQQGSGRILTVGLCGYLFFPCRS